tara:strand:- start:455 stop:757 length:303 start_codon:yes stop_codon:yes gene_type:complete
MKIRLLSEIPEDSNLLDVKWDWEANTVKGDEIDNIYWATLNADVIITFADGKTYSINRYYLYQIYNDQKLKDELYDKYKLSHFYDFGLDHKTVIKNKVTQ